MAKITTTFDPKKRELHFGFESGEVYTVKLADFEKIKMMVPPQYGEGETTAGDFGLAWGLKELGGNGGAGSGKSHDNSEGPSEAYLATKGRFEHIQETGQWRGGGGGGKSNRLTQDERAFCIVAEKQGKPFDVEADDVKESIEVSVIAAAKKAAKDNGLDEPKDAKESWAIVRKAKPFRQAKEIVRREDDKKKSAKGIDSLEL